MGRNVKKGILKPVSAVAKRQQPWRVKAVVFALHLFLNSMISIDQFGAQSSEA